MKNWIYWIIIAALVVLSFFAIRGCIRAKNNPISTVGITEVRDTIIKVDTVRIENPKLVYQRIRDTIYYPVVIRDTIKISIPIPITESHYIDSGLYDIWISGFECKLNSVVLYPKTVEVVHTVTKTILSDPRPYGWCAYVGLGVQYGVIQRKFDFGPQIGVGFYVRLNKKKKDALSF